MSIKEKLVKTLAEQGYADARERLHDAWLQTMPSYLGYEGINPLSVYYCYNRENRLWVVVLEVHNTFGERYVYLLDLGKCEESPANGFDHQWTFARRFHVSPFNDRKGFYTVGIVAPSHAPGEAPPDGRLPLPVVQVKMLSEDEATEGSPPSGKPGSLKLVATIRPTRATPLSGGALIAAIVKAPAALLLSMPRILYQAWILHYKKGLDVYARPEPYPTVSTAKGERSSADTTSLTDFVQGGIGWQPEGALEAYARRRIENYLRHRTDQTGVAVTIVCANPAVPAIAVESLSSDTSCATSSEKEKLVITCTTARFFSTLFIAPSASHALLLASDEACTPGDRIFTVSDANLFLRVFAGPSERVVDAFASGSPSTRTVRQRLRTNVIPDAILQAPHLSIPPRHFLEGPRSVSTPRQLVDLIVLLALLCVDALERWIFTAVKARFVPGDEPWLRWERAAKGLSDNKRD